MYLKNDVSLENRTVCLNTEMMPNGVVPWLVPKQVRIAYYFSALTQMVSGFFDNESEMINGYICQEGDAGNVANEIIY